MAGHPGVGRGAGGFHQQHAEAAASRITELHWAGITWALHGHRMAPGA